MSGEDQRLSNVIRAFDKANITETIKLSFNPQVLLEVTFPQPLGKPITLERAGVQLTINETAGPPVFSIVGNRICPGPFVVILVDPDALTPQNPAISQIRHFLAGNFVYDASPTAKYRIPLTNTTPAVTEFVRPRPFVGLDAHRYIFLLFEQSAAFNEQTLFNPASPRAYFNISSFAATVGLGQPIGGTFMWVGPDPSTASL
ncbi:hypothetical protein M413DRAFT_363235 [Hebeloma cylindrosporum]|uniref:PEBP-like protein n=1 Tax=Hebeloma cylindrosporum TaxID=76867 RepID=A0A0C3C7F3_HEBCY|nr:hypothetical protein M413DRAFT_363235 [Hebeloma cylindrosporum h7]